jgi:BASS family bile acid:Na+ symporter
VLDFAEFYLRHEYAFASTQLVFAMMGMGATVQRSDFVAVVRRPTAVTAGLALQLVGAPLLAAAIVAALGLPPGIAVGIVLIGAIPGGSLSNLFTFFARGNVALSITLTGVTTLACLVTTPVVLRLLAAQHLPAGFEMPAGRIAFEIAVCLLGPLAIGMAVGAASAGHRDAFSRWCIRGSLAVIGAMAVGSMSAGRVDPAAYGWEALAGMVLFAAALQALSVGVGRALRLPVRDRLALAVEVTIRNTNLGLLIKASVLPVRPGVADPVADGAFFMALFYGGVALAVASVPVLGGRRLVPAEDAFG